MATCKDCIHYEDSCDGYTPSDLDSDVFDYFRKGIPEEIPDIDKRCGSFKNKSDVVEVDKVAEMFAEQFGDKCPCNFNDNDEWLTLYCAYTNTCDCPCKDGWKQFIKHYDKRKEQ